MIIRNNIFFNPRITFKNKIMASIKITRESEYTNRMRAIKIFVDTVLVGTIEDGETKEFEMAAGSHVLEAKIDWCKSNTITFLLNQNHTKSFTLNSFAKNNPLGMFAAIYFISFGYNKYLKLKENIK
jgi:hypothetical protein